MCRLLAIVIRLIFTAARAGRGPGLVPAAAGTGRAAGVARATAPPGSRGPGPAAWPDWPADPATELIMPRAPIPAPAPAPVGPPERPRPDWRRRRRRLAWAAGLAAAALVFRRALASLLLTGLAAALHLIGISAHLPHVRFGWPWESIAAGRSTSTEVGPWVLQKIEGISRPALGQASFDFLFTHRVSKSIGPWPCWYASTFYAVGRASATVDLNPGASWWRPPAGHYRLQVLSRPAAGAPGRVSVAMVLPAPQLPQSPHQVTVDTMASRPVSVQHSWTYPGLGCGTVLRPQFPQSVLYAEAQRMAYARARSLPQVTRPLISSAEAMATRTIRDNFVQPTVNALGYRLTAFSLSWARPARAAPARTAAGRPGG